MKVKDLVHYQKLLKSNQSLNHQQIDKIINKYSKDLSVEHYFDDDGFASSSIALHDLNCDLTNCLGDRAYKKEVKNY